MQILITGDGEARTRVLQLSRARLAALVAGLLFLLLALSGTVYHFIFLAAARDGWPVVSQLVKLVVRDEFAQRDRKSTRLNSSHSQQSRMPSSA